MDDRRYRGQRRRTVAHRGPAGMWTLVGIAAAVIGVAWALVAVGSHSTPSATVRGDRMPTDASPVPTPGPPAPTDISPSSHASSQTSSPTPSSARPSLSPGDFTLTLSASSGPVTAGSQLSFTVRTTVVSGTPGQVTLTATGLPSAASMSFSPDSVDAGQTTRATIATSPATPPGTYPLAVSATAGAAHHSARYTLTVGAAQAVLNGAFESGLANWTSSGSASTVDSPVHGGATAVRLGTTTPSGDTTISQTVTVTGTGQLSLWYQMVCNDRVHYDWFDAWATDLTTNQSATLAQKTCHNSGSYQQVTATLTVGHQYRIVVENRDDNHSADASYTYVDDVSLT